MPKYDSGLSNILSHIREPAPPLSAAATGPVSAFLAKSLAKAPFQIDPESVPQATPLHTSQDLVTAHERSVTPEPESNSDSSKQWWFQRVFSRPQERAPDQLSRAAVSGDTISGAWLTVDGSELDWATRERVSHVGSDSNT